MPPAAGGDLDAARELKHLKYLLGEDELRWNVLVSGPSGNRRAQGGDGPGPENGPAQALDAVHERVGATQGPGADEEGVTEQPEDGSDGAPEGYHLVETKVGHIHKVTKYSLVEKQEGQESEEQEGQEAHAPDDDGVDEAGATQGPDEQRPEGQEHAQGQQEVSNNPDDGPDGENAGNATGPEQADVHDRDEAQEGQGGPEEPEEPEEPEGQGAGVTRIDSNLVRKTEDDDDVNRIVNMPNAAAKVGRKRNASEFQRGQSGSLQQLREAPSTGSTAVVQASVSAKADAANAAAAAAKEDEPINAVRNSQLAQHSQRDAAEDRMVVNESPAGPQKGQTALPGGSTTTSPGSSVGMFSPSGESVTNDVNTLDYK